MYILGEGNGTPLQYSCLENPMDGGAWWAAVHGVAKSRTRLSNFTFTFHFHALEKDMATHCSVLAWRIPGTGEPGGLPSMGLHRVRHDWSDLVGVAAYISISISIYIYTHTHTHTHTLFDDLKEIYFSWTEEPGRRQSMGSRRVGHDWVTFTFKEEPCDTIFHSSGG